MSYLTDTTLIDKMKVVELKHQLETLGFNKSGNKKDLVQRLKRYYEDNDNEHHVDQIEEVLVNDEMINQFLKDAVNISIEITEVPVPVIEFETEPETEIGIKRKRGENKEFDFEVTLENEEDVIELLDEDECWVKGNLERYKTGFKQNYKCKYFKQGCEALLHVKSDFAYTSYSIFRAVVEHTHHPDKISERGVAKELRETIIDLSLKGFKNKGIWLQLKRQELDPVVIPSVMQIKNFIANYRTATLGKPTMT